MNRQASNSVIDPRAAVYAREMELRARSRLLKYHYYMAKAYEYRLLQPYPYDLNIHSVYDMMQTFVDDPMRSHDLTQTDWDDLKAVYDDLLASITEEIYDEYQTNPSIEYTVPVLVTLSSDEIARLNAKLPVTVNFMERDRFQLDEEGIRIVEMGISSMSTYPEGSSSPDDYFDLRVEHSGFSKLQHDQDIYGFVHYKDNSQNPVNWNYRCYADGSRTAIDRSDASTSLLWSLLGRWGTPTDANVLLYTRPAAWADIVVSKIPHHGNQGDIVIDGLTLQLKYDFTYQAAGRRDLHVLTLPAELQPYILVDTEDMGGRQDGRGEFYRRYTSGRTAALTAPAAYGDWRFVKWRWTRNYNTYETTSQTLSVALTYDTTARAVYTYVGPVVSVADFNGDFSVDMRDFSILAGAWLTVPQGDLWEEACDISVPADYHIDGYDLEAFCYEWMTIP
jgi:hypothetical protein